MVERFYNELGRTIGTPSDPELWAGHFGCSVDGASHILKTLKATGRAIERNGLLYRN